MRGKEIFVNYLKLFLKIILKFEVINLEIAQQTQTSIIEFSLKINEQTFLGVDIINWEFNKIKRLTAYFFEKKNEN